LTEPASAVIVTHRDHGDQAKAGSVACHQRKLVVYVCRINKAAGLRFCKGAGIDDDSLHPFPTNTLPGDPQDPVEAGL
jgi:hypothetical protein